MHCSSFGSKVVIAGALDQQHFPIVYPGGKVSRLHLLQLRAADANEKKGKIDQTNIKGNQKGTMKFQKCVILLPSMRPIVEDGIRFSPFAKTGRDYFSSFSSSF